MTVGWENMTAEETVNAIRSDLKNTMTSVNMLIEHQRRLGEQLRAVQGELGDVKTVVKLLLQGSLSTTNVASNKKKLPERLASAQAAQKVNGAELGRSGS